MIQFKDCSWSGHSVRGTYIKTHCDTDPAFKEFVILVGSEVR